MREKLTQNLEFVGLNTEYPTAAGSTVKRTHLDGAASPLPSKIAIETANLLLPHYSNTHSYVHSSAQISTKALAWAHQQILGFLSASEAKYTAIFSGSGTTSAVNRVARGLHAMRPNKPVVLVSSMEHHANDLPHRQFDNQVRYIPTQGSGSQSGALDLTAYEQLLSDHSGLVNYVAVSSVSNVTGISNPIAAMTELAHQHGALIIVDGAQSVAHKKVQLDHLNPDFFIFSGHKAYTPASPGVLVAKRNVIKDMSGQDLGGGSVSTVSYYDFQLVDSYPDREQSGTPNIVGAITLGNVLAHLSQALDGGLSDKEQALMNLLFDELNAFDKVTIYGDHLKARTGALAFNHHDIDHGLLAAILNDYYGIAVRNECFCAHPYVSELLKEELWDLDLSGIPEAEQENHINRKRGMVRASISAYNNEHDIINLIDALRDIETTIEQLAPLYQAMPDGSYRHNTFNLSAEAFLPFLSH